MKKQILIAYSWSINNIGDIAITPGLIELFREFYPDAILAVMSMYSGEDQHYSKTQQHFETEYPDVNIRSSCFQVMDSEKRDYLIQTIAQDALGKEKLEAFNSGRLSLDEAETVSEFLLHTLPAEFLRQQPDVREAMNEYGFVLYNSGTTLNFGRGEPGRGKNGCLLRQRDFWYTTLIRAWPMVMANYLGIPFAIFAQSYDAIDYPANIFFAKLLANAVFIGARDPNSLSYMKSRGIRNVDLSFRPDSTFFAVGEDIAWADDFMSRHHLRDREFITLTIRSSVQGYINERREETYMACLREFLILYIERIGRPVLLCPEVRQEIDPMKELIYLRLPENVRKMCVYMDHFWTSEQARTVYARARTVVSMEMHSIILALGAGTPILHPRFAEAGRKAWMLKEMDMEDWLFDMDHLCPEELFAAAKAIDENVLGATAAVHSQLRQLKELARESIEKIKCVTQTQILEESKSK